MFQEQLTDELNRKLANKVLLNVGLCLSLYDILEVGESFVFPGKQMQACIECSYNGYDGITFLAQNEFRQN